MFVDDVEEAFIAVGYYGEESAKEHVVLEAAHGGSVAGNGAGAADFAAENAFRNVGCLPDCGGGYGYVGVEDLKGCEGYVEGGEAVTWGHVRGLR